MSKLIVVADARAVACCLAHCVDEDILSLAEKADGGLVVVVRPGPKYTYTLAEVSKAREKLAEMPNAYRTPEGDFVEPAKWSEEFGRAAEPEHEPKQGHALAGSGKRK